MENHTKILGYNISCKTFISAKPFRIRFDKVNSYISIYDGTRYLVLFGWFTTGLDILLE